MCSRKCTCSTCSKYSIYLLMSVLLVLLLTGSEVTRAQATDLRDIGSDGTVYEEGKGDQVVLAVIEKLDSVCIFKKDKQMLRTIALAASDDGQKAGTFRPGYFGGIWQVNETVFERTKDLSLSYLWRRFNSAFNIDWSAVEWRDLTKPLYSALAARLALASIADESNNEIENSLPWDLQNQANMWIHAFQLSGDLAAHHQIYQDAAQKLRDMSGCKSVGADIAFVMDGSGSINQADFQHSLSFIADVVSRLDIGPTSNQVSVIVFSSSATVEFHFNTYTTKEQIIRKITSGIAYPSGGTATDLALSLLHQNVFTQWNGARGANAIPQMAVLFTDGYANDGLAAQLEASRVHAKNITLLSVGIGSGVHDTELRGYASIPKCRNTYHLQGFFEMAELFAHELQERSCTEHGFVNPEVQGPDGSLPPPITIVLQPGQEQYICFSVVVAQGATIIVNGTTGTLTVYISFSVTRPSEEDYDRVMTVSAGQIKTMYLTSGIIASFVGPLPREVQICLTLVGGSNEDSSTSPNSTTAPGTGGGGGLIIVDGPVDCGAEERDMNDNDVVVITSPHFNQITNEPAGYRGGLNCVWKINTQPWTTLEFTMNYFKLPANYDVQPGRTCNGQDRVVISNPQSVVSGGYLCGSRPTGNVIPVSRTLNHTSVTFTSQYNTSTQYGFSITVRAIGRHQLTCNYSNIDLQLKKAYLPRDMPVSRYQLLDSSCKAIDKGQYLWMKTEYDQCGTRKDMTEESVYFTNQVHAAGLPVCTGPVCFDVPTVNIPFRCILDRKVKPLSGAYYPRPRTTLTKGASRIRSESRYGTGAWLNEDTVREATYMRWLRAWYLRLATPTYRIWIRFECETHPNLPFLEGTVGVGAMMTLGRDQNFDWSVEPDFSDLGFVGDRVFFEIAANDGNRISTNPAFVVAADQCWTTPTPNKNDETRFDILLDGCPVSDFVALERYYEADKDVFSVNAVYFFNETTGRDLHFHCIVRVCSVGQDEHLCDRSCITPINGSPRVKTSPVVKKKEAVMQRTAQRGFVRFGGPKGGR